MGVSSHELDDAMRWYREKHTELVRRYRGEYVAIIARAVVDHDSDFEALASRVFQEHGTRSIYMPRVQEEHAADARVRSPRHLKS